MSQLNRKSDYPSAIKDIDATPHDSVKQAPAQQPGLAIKDAGERYVEQQGAHKKGLVAVWLRG